MRSRLGLALLLLLAAAFPAAAAEEPQWEWNDVPRVVAIGDVHGAYDNLVAVLKNAGFIDDDERWIGGKTHLVQNGDIVDRGPHSRRAMDLLMELEEKAEKAGARVHVLTGNHEAMNVVGILDLVSAEEYQSYVDRDSRMRREATFERYYDDLKRQAKERGEEPPRKDDLEKEFLEKYPLGFIEHRQAFGPEGRYGKWIRGHNAAVRINGVVFSHGDWSEKFSQLGIAEVNRRIRAELSGELPLEEGITFDPESPLQYRGLAQTSLTRSAQDAEAERVSRILQNLGAARMVVGHTLTSGVIESRFGGKHISIDTGMLELYRGGHRIALEIENGRLHSLHDRGKVPIPETMDETNFEDYVRTVAEVDPENVDAQIELVDSLQARGQIAEAASILEGLFERSEHVPFRYRDLLGSHYEARGRTDLAREQYLEYIEGLDQLLRASPENLNLANLLARFCAEKGLELDRAKTAIDRALETSPGSSSFLLTRARVQIARREFEEALGVLSGIPQEPGLGYEVHYFSGLAYLGLKNEEKARAAFEEAVRAEPSRREAREELRKLDEIPSR